MWSPDSVIKSGGRNLGQRRAAGKPGIDADKNMCDENGNQYRSSASAGGEWSPKRGVRVGCIWE